MAVRLVPRRDPRKVPQFTVWTLRKNRRTREGAGEAAGIRNEGTGFQLLGWLRVYEDRCPRKFLAKFAPRGSFDRTLVVSEHNAVL